MKKVIIIFPVIILLFLFGCTEEIKKADGDYNNYNEHVSSTETEKVFPNVIDTTSIWGQLFK
jgi:hypothetical protein